MNIREIAFGLIGGLGLFLYGMHLMGGGLQKAAGDKMRRLLEILTSNPVVAVLVGTGVTAIIQSSSATTVMVVGFVNAGLMTLKQAIGVILGANIGTTITTQLVSFKLTELAEPSIGIGLLILLAGKKERVKHIGQVILGFGILFYGMSAMSHAMKPLRTYEPFLNMLASFGKQPLLGVFISALFTAIIQSSSATTAIVVALASQGILSLESALPLILGSNIGTTITAVLASIGTNLTAKRAAVAHAVFNIGGVLLFLLILKPFAYVAGSTSVVVERQVANAHTIFNVFNTLVVLPFISVFTSFVTKLVPGKDREIAETMRTLYLDRHLLPTPSIALGQGRRELLRMGEIASRMLEETMLAFNDNDVRYIKTAKEKEQLLNFLEKEIMVYLVEVSQASLSAEQSDTLNSLLEIVNDIERVGDHADNIIELAEYKIENTLPFSDAAIAELQQMYSKVKEMFDNSLHVLESGDKFLAGRIEQAEDQIDQLEQELRQNHIDRLNKHICYPGSGIVYLDVISNMERIADHASSIARAAIRK